MNYEFATVVWGDAFTSLYLKVSLPTLLSPGNLGSFRGKRNSVYRIYTTPQDAKRIKESPAFLKLSEIMPTELIFMQADDFKHQSFECYLRAINKAIDDDASFVLLHPDGVWGDGAFANLQKIATTGKKAVMFATFRVAKETFVPPLLKRFLSEDGLVLSVPPRELVKLALRHLHWETGSHFWNSSHFFELPSILHWNVKNEGMLLRYFRLNPLMSTPTKRFEMPLASLDSSDYIIFANPKFDDLHIVQDSDEIVVFDMCDSKYPNIQIPRNRANVFKVAYWAAGRDSPFYPNTNLYSRRFFKYKIRIHSGDISPRWKEVEKSSDRIVNSILFLLRFTPVWYNIKITWEYIIGLAKSNRTSVKKLVALIIHPKNWPLLIATFLLAFNRYPQVVFWLNKYVEHCDEKHFDREKVQYLISSLGAVDNRYAEQILDKLREKGYLYSAPTKK